MNPLPRPPLTPSDRQSVVQLLLDMEKNIKDNQSEIDRLKSAALSLENKQKGLKRMLSVYRSLLSPVHRAPDEILAQILTFRCEEDAIRPSFTGFGGRRFRRAWANIPSAIHLSRVCRRWREVMLSTPRLWSSIQVDFDEDGWKGDADRLLRMVQLFVARSKSSPLDLQLDFDCCDRNGIDPEFLPALQCLIDTCRRWSTLSLKYRQGTLENSVFHCIRGHLPMLKYLEITGFVFDDDSDRAPLIDLFSDCPALESLFLQPGVIHRDKLNLPWHQIRTLSFYRTGWGPRFSSLSLFPNVETLELLNSYGDDLVDEFFYEGDHVTSNSKKLIMEVEYQEEISGILGHSTFPHLTSIEISGPSSFYNEGDPTWKEWEDAPMKSFLLRSSCSITSLIIQNVPITSDQTISLLWLLPDLKLLSLGEYRTQKPWYRRILTESFSHLLSVNHDCYSDLSIQFLSRLTHLTLRARSKNLNQVALREAIASRWLPDPEYASQIGVDCLQSICIELMGKEGPGMVLYSLRELQAAGMRVEITHTCQRLND